MNRPPLTNNLNEIVRKIRALKRLHEATGFSTNRTIVEMLSRLTEEDQIAIGEAFMSDTNNQ